MDDAVGEVLAQRRALDRGAGGGIALSLLFHGVITAAALFAALRHPAEQNVPVIEIKLAKPAAAPVPAAPVPATPVPDGGLKPAAPRKPEPQPKPAAKPVPVSPYGKSAKKPTEQPSIPAPPQPATRNPQPATSNSQPETQPVGAVVEGDFPYSIYIERMKTLIGQHWFRPQAAAGAATTIRFVIDRDGAVRNADTETPSGNGTFDRAALRAVMESSPLPPLPFGYAGTSLNVHLTFK